MRRHVTRYALPILLAILVPCSGVLPQLAMPQEVQGATEEVWHTFEYSGTSYDIVRVTDADGIKSIYARDSSGNRVGNATLERRLVVAAENWDDIDEALSTPFVITTSYTPSSLYALRPYLEDRTDDEGNQYSVTYPSAMSYDWLVDNVLEEGWIDKGLDDYDKRFDIYRKVVWSTVLGELTIKEQQRLTEETKWLLEQVKEHESSTPQVIALAEKVIGGLEISAHTADVLGDLFAVAHGILEKAYLDHFLRTGEHLVHIHHWSVILGKFSSGLKAAPWAAEILHLGGELVQAMMWNALATAEAQARLDTLTRLAQGPEWDPAFIASLTKVQAALDEYSDCFASALWEGVKDAVLNMHTVDFLVSVVGKIMTANTLATGAIASLLGISTATAATIVIPIVLITYAVLRGIYEYVNELHDQVRGFVLSATLNRYLGAYMPDTVPATLEDVEYAVRINNMGYYLEHYYYYQYRDYNGRLWVWSDTPELNSQLDAVIQSSLEDYWLTAAPYWLATDEWPELGVRLTTPTVIIDTLNDGASVSGTVSISAHATDDDRIADMTLRIGSTSITSGVTVDITGASATLSYEWDTSTLDPGSAHRILVKAKDSSGQESDDLVSVTIESEEGDPPPVSHAGMGVSATGPIPLDGHSVSEVTAVVTKEDGDPIGGVEVWFWSYPSDYAGFAEPDGTLLPTVNLYIATTSYATGEATAFYRPTRWGRTYIMAETRTGLSAETYFDSVYEPAAPADFHIDVSPTTRDVGRSESTTYEVTVVPENGYYRPVTLSAENLPADVTAPDTVVLPGEPTTIQVSVGKSAPYGTHAFQFVGTGDDFSRSVDAVLVIEQGTIHWIWPNGGETLYRMTHNYTIEWDYVGGGTVNVDVSYDGGRSWYNELISWPNTGSYDEWIPWVNMPHDKVLFRISAVADPSVVDVSDGFFKVCDHTLFLRLVSPDGNEVLPPGSFHDIEWITVSDAEVTSIDILFSSDNGSSWTQIVTGYPDTGHYQWHLPTEMSDQCRIKIAATDASMKTGEDESAASFTIGLDPGAWISYRFGRSPERIQVHPTDSCTAYFGEDGSGVWKTTDCGETVSLLEAGPVDVVDIEMDPNNPNTIYACEEGGGLWKTTNGGDYWQVIASGDYYYAPCDEYYDRDYATAIVIHPDNSNILVLGTEEQVFKSTNGGSSWDCISCNTDCDNYEVNEGCLVIDPNNPNVLYMADSRAILKSTDGGYNWVNVYTASGEIYVLAIDLHNSNIIYAGGDGGLYKTTDAGATWTGPITPSEINHIYGLAIDPVNANTIYVGSNSAGVLKSIDGGSTWSYIGPEGCSMDGVGIGTMPLHLLYAGSTTGVDGVWVLNLDPQPAAIVISPNGGEEWMAGSNHDILWATTDPDGAGPVDLYYSDTGDTPWETIATGLADTGNYSWKLPIIPGESYKVRVVVHHVEGETVEAVSGAAFNITPETMPPTIPEIGVGQEVTDTAGIPPLIIGRVSSQTLGGLAGEIGTLLTISSEAADSLSGVDPTSIEAHLQYPDDTDVVVIPLYDDGTGPDETAEDGIFTGQWDSLGATEAFHFVDISASDLSGNERVVDNAVLVDVFDYPSVTAISYDPSSPTDQAGVTVNATVTDASGISIASIEYSSDGGTTWPSVSMNNTTGDEWSGTIPQLAAGTVQFRIMATDTLGHSTTTTADAYDVLDVTPPTVYIAAPTGNSTPVSSAIEIGFSEAMNTYSVEGAISISPVITYSSFWMGDRLLIMPDDELLEETEYTVTVMGTVQDGASNGLDGDSDGIEEGSPDDDYIWSFTTSSQNVEVELSLLVGWNMISLPVEPETTDLDVILPDVEVIYTWNCETTSYDSPDEIVPDKSYWALVFEDVTETIYGTPVEGYQLSSDCEGWHMIGGLPVEAEVIVDSGDVYDTLYHWDPETLSYIARPLDDVRPGEGYWLLAFTDFSISVVPRTPAPP